MLHSHISQELILCHSFWKLLPFGSRSPKSFLNSGFIFPHFTQCLSRLLRWAEDSGAPRAGGIARAPLLPFVALNISFDSLCPKYWTEWAAFKLLSLSAESVRGRWEKKTLFIKKKERVGSTVDVFEVSSVESLPTFCSHSNDKNWFSRQSAMKMQSTEAQRK